MDLNEYVRLIVEEKAHEIVRAHEKALDKVFYSSFFLFFLLKFFGGKRNE